MNYPNLYKNSFFFFFFFRRTYIKSSFSKNIYEVETTRFFFSKKNTQIFKLVLFKELKYIGLLLILKEIFFYFKKGPFFGIHYFTNC